MNLQRYTCRNTALTAIIVIGLGGALSVTAAGIIDCNGNGVDDAIDIANGTSEDCDGNAIPDECDTDVEFSSHLVSFDADGPTDIFGIDVDGDGDADVLSTSRNDDKIAWYENLGGARSFGPQQVISTDMAEPNSVYGADLDRDGDVDVLSASEVADTIAWHENLDGAGHFGPLRVISAEADGGQEVRAVDLDGDGDIDVLAAATDSIVWYANDGVGNFGIGRTATTALSPDSICAPDLDGDGDPDILAGNSGWDDDNLQRISEIVWYPNSNGAGEFGAARLIANVPSGSVTVHAADLDGDGDVDALSANWENGDIAWYENLDGAGNFGIKRLIYGETHWAGSVGAADLDGDGDMDVLSMAHLDYEIAWYENLDGTGSFGPPTQIAYAYDPYAAVPTDLDGDGDIDVLSASSGDDKLLWHENTSDDCNGNESPDACDLDGASADCNLNGVPDECDTTNGWDCNTNGIPDDCDISLGSSDDCNTNGVPDECEFDCNDNGVPDSCDIDSGGSPDCNDNRTPDECEPDCNGNGVADGCDITAGSDDCDSNGVPDECQPDCDDNGIADACDPDCNENGVADICDIDSGASGDCNLNGIPDECDTQPVFSGHPISSNAVGARAVSAVDLDGDGDLDAVSASQLDDKIAWYENLDGAGNFGPEQTISLVADGAHAEHTADLDGDGDPDVLYASIVDSTIAWHENLDGLGAFGPRQIISTAAAAPYSVIAADVDDDGDLDVISASYDDDKVAWYENLDGEGSFGPQQIISLDADGARSVFAADLDGDGDTDVLSASFEDDKLAWYENLDGAGAFGSEQLISLGAKGATSIFGADVDGDGDIDVLSSSYDDNKISRHENLDGAGNFGSRQVLSSIINGARSVRAADVDHDGDADVLAAAETGSLPDGVEGIVWFQNVSGSGGFGPLLQVSHQADGGMFTSVGDLDGDGDTDVLAAAYLNSTIAWYENHGDDCNGNLVPDECEPDCNGNGMVDECEVSAGIAFDCNRNGVPDECDSTCVPPCDADGDACLDDLDCDPADGTVWAEPESIDTLSLSHAAPTTTLTWHPPADTGSDTARYDTLRSAEPSDFDAEVDCLESDDTDLTSADTEYPASAGVFYYLIRVENDCPGGLGAMGSDWTGAPRTGAVCP